MVMFSCRGVWSRPVDAAACSLNLTAYGRPRNCGALSFTSRMGTSRRRDTVFASEPANDSSVKIKKYLLEFYLLFVLKIINISVSEQTFSDLSFLSCLEYLDPDKQTEKSCSKILVTIQLQVTSLNTDLVNVLLAANLIYI